MHKLVVKRLCQTFGTKNAVYVYSNKFEQEKDNLTITTLNLKFIAFVVRINKYLWHYFDCIFQYHWIDY